MSVIYIMIPLAIVLATAALVGFIWSVKRGQLDDLDTPPARVLFDDED
ncbi:MAG: cbb3-type cytochrome oxidase assembly protein CcoS [Planctomycetota bacterium]